MSGHPDYNPQSRRTPWKRLLVTALLAVVSCSVAAWEVCQYERRERPFAIERAESRERQLHDEQLHHSKERLRSLGAILIEWHNTDKACGVYGDFSHWRGKKSDFAGVEDLKYESSPVFLSLQGSNFGNDEIHYLKGVKCLVDLTNTEVTEAGIAELQKDVPNVTVIRTAASRRELARSPDKHWIRWLPAYAKAPQEMQDPTPPFPAPRTMQPSIAVLTGTTLLISGQRCKLLGIEDSDNPSVRMAAFDFAKAWVKSTANYVGIMNDSNPLRLEDGTCLVWLRNDNCGMSYLNVELVRAGLVRVDYSKWEEYAFLVPMKGPDAFEVWQELLDRAATDTAKGGELQERSASPFHLNRNQD